MENTSFPTEEERDENLFVTQNAVEAILAWKAHQIRVVRQDECRLQVIEKLSENTALIVQDFAMKFLPAEYREAQSDFFGKRGISWHISVCTRKNNDKLESQTLVHILESGLQDSSTVVSVMEHVLKSLKEQHPEMIDVYFRQDNAGCYHCANTILSCNALSEKTGIRIRQIDFSDPQGGKGACDRKAAQIKSHVRRFIDEGNSVTTPQEFLEAIESHGGIGGVRVVVVRAQKERSGSSKRSTVKWEGISSFNNLSFSLDGVTAFRAYKVGSGRLFKNSHFKGISVACS